MVLVPKNKYEHLLKLEDEFKPSVQTGGQNRQESSEIPTQKTDETMSEVATIPKKEQTNLVNTTEEKPRLFVDKPLSKMHFIRRTSTPLKKKKTKQSDVKQKKKRRQKKKVDQLHHIIR